MARFIKGDIIVGWFPFSDATGSKKRPALILASWSRQIASRQSQDYLLCMISSQNVIDPYSFPLQARDVENGSLHTTSYLRPSYLFSADEGIIIRKIGILRPETLAHVVEIVQNLID